MSSSLARTTLPLCALLAACTGEIGDSGTKPQTSVAGGPATAGESSESGEPCTGAALVPARVRKLTDAQYARVVGDLLPQVRLPNIATPGSELSLIKDSSELVVRGPLAAQYWDGAFAIAKQAAADPASLTGCTPALLDAAAQRGCARAFVDAFGQRVFRRPLSEQDAQPLLAVYDVGAETSFAKGIELVVASLLQSADFLYRSELGAAGEVGTEVTLTPYEVASLLSFMLVGSAPDVELYAAAQAGTLATDAGIAQQVTRLLGLPAAQQHLTGVFTEVLGAEGALTSQRDPQAFPQLDLSLRQAMADEIHAFVRDNVFAARPLSDLFTSREALVTDNLAAFYGVSHSGPASLVLLPADQRGGILSRGAALLSLPTGSRAVHRGLFIASNYLCRVLSPPPASVQAEITQTLALGLDERQLSELRASKPVCAGCHANFDSLGLAFEHYDFIGKYLAERDGALVDAHGTLNNTDVDGPFADVVELGALLAKSKDVAMCLPQRIAAQALGLTLDDGEKCAVQQLVEPWARSDTRLGALVPRLTQSRFFLHRSRVN